MTVQMSVDQLSEGRGPLYTLILAALPALVYYFGWVHLYFYLNAFGISISELDLDARTIFMYPQTPLSAILSSVPFPVALLLALLAAVTWLAWRYCSNTRQRASLATVRLPGFWLTLFLIVVVMAISPRLISHLAEKKAFAMWESEAQVVALTEVPKKHEFSSWYQSYAQCVRRRGLRLIFADKATYYMLCVSTFDASEASVYEVRREGGLMSARIAYRPANKITQGSHK